MEALRPTRCTMACRRTIFEALVAMTPATCGFWPATRSCSGKRRRNASLTSTQRTMTFSCAAVLSHLVVCHHRTHRCGGYGVVYMGPPGGAVEADKRGAAGLRAPVDSFSGKRAQAHRR